MIEKTEVGTQILEISSETIGLRFRQEPEMDIPENETSADELTLRSVDERIEQTTDPILRRVEDLCALLASRTEIEYAGNSEASGSKRNRESINPSRNWFDIQTAKVRVGGSHLCLCSFFYVQNQFNLYEKKHLTQRINFHPYSKYDAKNKKQKCLIFLTFLNG